MTNESDTQKRKARLVRIALTMSNDERDQWKRDIAHEHGADSDQYRLVRDAVTAARESERVAP